MLTSLWIPTQALPPLFSVLLDGHALSDGGHVLEVNLCNSDACCEGIIQLCNDLSPGVYDQRVAVALPLLVVLPCLCCSNHIALRLHGSCSQQQLPVCLT